MMVTPSAAGSRRRKWVRHGRRYPSAMWHADWHEMKDRRFQGCQPIACPDDAPGCVAGAAACGEAASGNAVAVLQTSMAGFGTPATMPSDNGSCLAGVGRRTPAKPWTPTASGEELPGRGTGLISARPRHPQTNGRPERFRRTPEEGLRHSGGLPELVAYHNEVRPRWSPRHGQRRDPAAGASQQKSTGCDQEKRPRVDGEGHQ